MLRSIAFFTLALLSVARNLHAQPMWREWTTYFDGNMNGYDVARDVQITDSQMVVVTGTSYHLFAGGNFTTMLLDELGNIRWKDHYYSAETGVINGGQRIRTATGNTFYAVGTLAFRAGDLTLMKYGPGGRRWTQNFTPSYWSDYPDAGLDLAIDSSENLYAIGVVTSTAGNLNDVYTVKCDSSGASVWEQSYSGASGDDFPACILTAPGGGCQSLAGCFNFFGSGNYDFTILAYDAAGNTAGTTYMNSPTSRNDRPRDMVHARAGGWLIAGFQEMNVSYTDALFGKVGPGGTTVWRGAYAGTASQSDTAIQILETAQADAIVLIHSKESVSGNVRDAITLLSYDSGGSLQWAWSTLGPDSLGAWPAEMILDASGTIYVCGAYVSNGQQHNGLLAAIDATGQEQWLTGFDGGFNLHDGFTGIASDSSGGIYVCGYSRNGIANSRYVVAKYSFNGTTGIPEGSSTGRIAAYPQPARAGEVLFLKGDFREPGLTVPELYSSDGRLVCKLEIMTPTQGKPGVLLPASLTSGYYILTCNDPEIPIRQSLIITR